MICIQPFYPRRGEPRPVDDAVPGREDVGDGLPRSLDAPAKLVRARRLEARVPASGDEIDVPWSKI